MSRVAIYLVLLGIGPLAMASSPEAETANPLAGISITYEPMVSHQADYLFSQETFNRLGENSGGMTVAGTITHKVTAAKEGNRLVHDLKIARLSAQYVDHDHRAFRYDRSAEPLFGQSLIVHTDAGGRARHLPRIDSLPSIPGIAISTLVDLRELVPPLPDYPVLPGDQWTGGEKISFEREDGGTSSLEIEWELEFVGMEEMAGSPVMKIVGSSVLENGSEAGPGHRFSSTEKRHFSGYFSPRDGAFIALEIEADESPMQIESVSEGTVKEGIQRYRYSFRREGH